jgi:regulator of protease activity HflC (stomatin/prohibitin superfamily)
VDVHVKLDELTALISNARAMPMSASCVVNRTEVLAQLDEIRALLPGALSEAQRVIDDKGAVVAEGHAEADRIIEAAKAERARLVARTEVMREASREAERSLTGARTDADRMRIEIDDYVDGKLANFEVVLQKTLQAVEKGRAKISGRHELDSLAGPEPADEPFLPD